MTSISPEELASRTELVLVKPDATRKEVEALCHHAKINKFRAVCVNSSRVAEAFAVLEETDVKVISTIAFPLGAADSDVKRYEAEVGVDSGAQEFEVVLNLGKIKDGDEAAILRELRDIVDAVEERPVSILLGSKLLTRDEHILICNLAVEAGAKFVNTGNADLETIQLVSETVGKKLALKVSGEVTDAEAADALIKIGATHFVSPFKTSQQPT